MLLRLFKERAHSAGHVLGIVLSALRTSVLVKSRHHRHPRLADEESELDNVASGMGLGDAGDGSQSYSTVP